MSENTKVAIEEVKKLLRKQEKIQKWLKKNGKPKNQNIQHKIAFAYAVLDFLYHNECRTHKALLPNSMFFKDGSVVAKGIEDVLNRDVQSFVKKVRSVAFRNPAHWFLFRVAPSRRGQVLGLESKYETISKLVGRLSKSELEDLEDLIQNRYAVELTEEEKNCES